MNKDKMAYEAPEAQTFVVQTEGVICESLKDKSMEGNWGLDV